jgi:hypothetical protein
MAELKTFTLDEVKMLMKRAANESSRLTTNIVMSKGNRPFPKTRQMIVDMAAEDMLSQYESECLFYNKHDKRVWK